mmetsp:Transcript_20247/g.52266  ORF Transcript_20247/g.52266 Transcript_20247/m.52266 type:complete len:354 (+) Transcript_20247:938-1999(+)
MRCELRLDLRARARRGARATVRLRRPRPATQAVGRCPWQLTATGAQDGRGVTPELTQLGRLEDPVRREVGAGDQFAHVLDRHRANALIRGHLKPSVCRLRARACACAFACAGAVAARQEQRRGAPRDVRAPSPPRGARCACTRMRAKPSAVSRALSPPLNPCCPCCPSGLGSARADNCRIAAAHDDVLSPLHSCAPHTPARPARIAARANLHAQARPSGAPEPTPRAQRAAPGRRHRQPRGGCPQRLCLQLRRCSSRRRGRGGALPPTQNPPANVTALARAPSPQPRRHHRCLRQALHLRRRRFRRAQPRKRPTPRGLAAADPPRSAYLVARDTPRREAAARSVVAVASPCAL